MSEKENIETIEKMKAQLIAKNSGKPLGIEYFMEEIIKRLSLLYGRIYSCKKCVNSPGCRIKTDPNRIERLVERGSLESKLFIIGQALGGQAQRLSGRPYIKVNGQPSPTGNGLDTFLHSLGYTINASILSADLRLAYSSDIVQCYPGKEESGKGDHEPEKAEIMNCINQGFLFQEIEAINPKIILLMGKTSRDSFYRYILKKPYSKSLTAHINQIADNKILLPIRVFNKNIFIIPIQHPSGANPRFREMLNNKNLVNLIKDAIR